MTGIDRTAGPLGHIVEQVSQPADWDLAVDVAARRQRAEARLQEGGVLSLEGVAAMSPMATQKLLHKLQVHQIELDMQNEELRESQLALDAVRERYFDLYDLAPVGYCTVSQQGLVLQANLSAATLFGMPRSALLKQPLSCRIARDDQDIFYLHRKRIVEDSCPQSFEIRMGKQDGTLFWAQMNMSVGHNLDGVPEVRVVLFDISERKQTEAERALFHQVLLEKNVELERARTDAEKANLAKSDFLSSMSHELRTPLHAILGFGQLLENETPPPTPAQQKSIEQILKAGWYLLKLVNEVLDLAVIESGKLVLSTVQVSLQDVMQECAAMVAPLAQEHAISVTFPSDELPYFVQADHTWVKQALINLLSNAIKYNRPDGTVNVTCSVSAPDRIRLSVENTGAGLSPEKLAQLFQPFNRLGQEAGAVEGTGIGLVVCMRLVELMGGAIGAESTVGEKSLFWIELDLVATSGIVGTPPEPTDRMLPAHQDPAEQAGVKTRTLLYVEDNPANLLLVQAIVARIPSFRMLSAANGIRGVAMARDILPDLILMDINLPDISGTEALKLLSEDPATARIPVIALSANAMLSDIENGLKAGFFRYLTKPIKVNEFVKMLELAP